MSLVRIQLRHDTYQNWYDNNPLLLAGEAAVVTDTGKVKVGDGTRNFRSLPYVSADFHPSLVPPAVGTGAAGVSVNAARADHTHDLPESISVKSVSATSATVSGDLTVTGSLVGGSHKHSISDVDGLPGVLLDTAAADHTHTTSDIKNFPSTATGEIGSVLTWDGFSIVWADPQDNTGGNVTGLTAEEVDDRIGQLLQQGDGISMVYDDTADTLTVSLADSGEWTPAPIPSPPSGVTDPNAPTLETPEITVQPESSIDVTGQAIEISIVVTGVTSPQYQWQSWNGSSWVDLANTGVYSGATTTTLSLSSTGESDNDTYYRCKVLDSTSATTLLISSNCELRWIDPNAPVPALVLTQDLPSEINARYDSSGNYDLSGLAAVVATGGTGTYAYKWQAANVVGSSANGFGRGTIWLNLSGETSSSLASVSDSSVIWLQESSHNPSFEEKIIYLRCVVTSVTDVFNLTGPSVASSEVRVVISPPPAAITADPQDAALSTSGTASFTASFGGRAEVEWEVRDYTGAVTQVPLSHGTNSVIATGTLAYQATLSLSGLQESDIGNEYRIRVTSIDGADTSVSGWASLTGNPVRITKQPPATVPAIYGSSVNISFEYDPTAGTTVSWETRASYSASPTTVAGQTSTTLALTSVTQNAEFRGVVTSASGVTKTAWSLVGVVTPSADTGSAFFTQQLSGAALYENQFYTDSATSSLLAGAEATDHYAVLAVEFSDGRKELRPLATGQDKGYGPLRFFPANQGYTHYRVNTQIDGQCTVSILAAVNPHAVSGTSGTIQGSPWAEVGGRAFYTQGARGSVISFPKADGQYVVTNGLAQQTGVIQYPFPAYGFSRSQEIEITVQRQEPFYGPVGNGPWSPPQSNSLRGAANADGIVVAGPHSQPDVTILLSEDEGKTWGTRFAPFPVQVHDIVFFQNFFYAFAMAPGNRLTAIRSEDGESWADTGWSFGVSSGSQSYGVPLFYDPSLGHDKPNQARASVADGVMYLSVHERSGSRYRSYLWRCDGSGWTRIAMPGYAGVVSGAANYLVSGQCYSTNGGTSWDLAPGAVDIGGSGGLYGLDFVEGMWEMRPVTYGGTTYYISHNRPDDRYHYHYTPTASSAGSRLSYLDQFASLRLPYTTTATSGGNPSWINTGSGARGRWFTQWGPFVGPPVGQHLYALAISSESDQTKRRPVLLKLNAAAPNVPGGPEVLVKFEHAHAEKYGGYFDATISSPSLYRGGYNYGPQDQLDTMYLDGTWSPNAGPLIFCRNRVLAAFRTGKQIPDGTPGGGFVGPPPPNDGNV